MQEVNDRIGCAEKSRAGCPRALCGEGGAGMRAVPLMRRFVSAGLVAMLACAPVGRAQDPLVAFPRNYVRVFGNSVVDVIRVHYRPYEKVGMHDHSQFPTVYVYLNDAGPVRFEHHEAGLEALTRPPTVKGSYRISPGRVERHAVENLSGTSSDFLRIELKQVPLGAVQPFRGEAVRDVRKSKDMVEVRTPVLEVERVVCVEAAGCAVKALAVPSLLVAVTAAEMSDGKLAAGAVRWLPGGASAQVRPGGEGAAQVLRVVLPGTRR